MQILTVTTGFVVLLSVTLASNTDSSAVKFTDCNADNQEDANPNMPAALQAVRITGCTGHTCVLKSNTPYVFELDFRANQDSRTAIIAMFYEDLIVGHWNIAIADEVRNACNQANFSCPLQQGQNYTIKYPFVRTERKITRASGQLSINLSGDHGLLVCALLTVQLRD